MNNEKLAQRLKDPKFYIENFCKIKGKKPGLTPFILNEPQKDIFNTMNTKNRIIILKARQLGFCVDKNTKILSNDLRWINAGDIQIGQEIISVDEAPSGGRGSTRKMKHAIVENKWSVYEEAFQLTFDNGEEVIATGPHRFLSKKWSTTTDTIWRKVEDMKIGDQIRTITKTWGEPSVEDGWFSGMIDGEGSISKKSRTGASINIAQTSGPVWERLKKYCVDNKLNYRIEWDKRKSGSSSKLGSKDVGKIVFSNMPDMFQVIGKTRPTRMVNNDWWNGKRLPDNGWVKITSIKSLGKREMIDLQTSEKTFIANGLVSHNSTAVTGWIYHRTITTPGTTSALIGYNSDLTKELLDKVKMFYATTPHELRPTIQYNSKFEISFPKINSKILVLPSTENVGRGYTLHNVLLTELAMWEKAEEKMVAIENSVPINGKIIVESTPNGVGNKYHKMWVGDNDYVKKEYGWWWLYSEEEIETIRRRMNNPQKFAQEYGLEFLASGRPVFDQAAVTRQRKGILSVGEAFVDSNGTSHTVRKERDWRFYKEPTPTDTYVIGVDTSEGVTGGDYSVAVIFNRMTGEEVAFFRGIIPPDKFAEELDTIGRKYNNALMVVESNNHGLVTLTVLKQMFYPTLYFRPSKFESISSPWSDKLGWKTTVMTRPLLIDDLNQVIRDGVLTLHSKETLDEMNVFVYDKNNAMTPQEGFHDDCIFATGIAYQGFKVMYDKKLDQLDYEQHLPQSFNY